MDVPVLQRCSHIFRLCLLGSSLWGCCSTVPALFRRANSSHNELLGRTYLWYSVHYLRSVCKSLYTKQKSKLGKRFNRSTLAHCFWRWPRIRFRWRGSCNLWYSGKRHFYRCTWIFLLEMEISVETRRCGWQHGPGSANARCLLWITLYADLAILVWLNRPIRKCTLDSACLSLRAFWHWRLHDLQQYLHLPDSWIPQIPGLCFGRQWLHAFLLWGRISTLRHGHVQESGCHWASSLLAFLTICFVPFPFVL